MDTPGLFGKTVAHILGRLFDQGGNSCPEPLQLRRRGLGEQAAVVGRIDRFIGPLGGRRGTRTRQIEPGSRRRPLYAGRAADRAFEHAIGLLLLVTFARSKPAFESMTVFATEIEYLHGI